VTHQAGRVLQFPVVPAYAGRAQYMPRDAYDSSHVHAQVEGEELSDRAVTAAATLAARCQDLWVAQVSEKYVKTCVTLLLNSVTLHSGVIWPKNCSCQITWPARVLCSQEVEDKL
jgi:hypothetical protein